MKLATSPMDWNGSSAGKCAQSRLVQENWGSFGISTRSRPSEHVFRLPPSSPRIWPLGLLSSVADPGALQAGAPLESRKSLEVSCPCPSLTASPCVPLLFQIEKIMSSIGEGINFSQEQQRISGRCRHVSRAHGPWRPPAPVPLAPKADPEGERSASGHGAPLSSSLSAAPLPVLCGAMAPSRDGGHVCKLRVGLPIQKPFFLMSSRYSFLS